MKTYMIQREKTYSKIHIEWELAWGLKARSYIKANSDDEAKIIFFAQIAKSKVDKFRLVGLEGFGYSVSRNVIAERGQIK